jgi:transcriptional regulator with XRE-family HTH domain
MPRLLIYSGRMPRKTTRAALVAGPAQADWFLPEWMATLRVTQADLGRETGMSKSTISEIVNGKTHYYRALLNEMARALKIAPFELLLPPEEAFALRRMRDDAVRIAAEPHTPWRHFPKEQDSDHLPAPRRAG